jgi:hypothetical protein
VSANAVTPLHWDGDVPLECASLTTKAVLSK